MKEDLNKWKDIRHSWIRRLNIKMIIFPKLVYRSNTVPIKIPDGFFAEIHKLILKFTGPTRPNTILRNNKVGGFTISDFLTYYTTKLQ